VTGRGPRSVAWSRRGVKAHAIAGAALAAALGIAAGCDGDSGRDASRSDTPTTPTSAEPSAPPSPDTAPPPVVAGPADLELPASAAAVAEIVARVELAFRRDPPPVDLAVLGWEQQNAYRALSAHPEWVDDVLGAVPPELAAVVTANLDAVTSIAVLNTPQPALPDWAIEAPLPPEILLGYYREAEAASGIPWPYLAAIHLVETRMGRIRGLSSAGAQGPMQFIPATWAAFGEGDVNDNRDAILAAGRYLDASGGPDDMDRALFAYNNHDDYVRAIQAYATLIGGDERVYGAYHQWQVYYATVDGVWFLPEGYPAVPSVPVPGPASR
jgi:soluble lytic murein transglycosylase-like protein